MQPVCGLWRKKGKLLTYEMIDERKKKVGVYKISVIIATYNTADYLEECLDSIFGQTLKDIEVILIDDGSTDNTEDIIDKYKQKYNNLVSFYQENQGAGKARNYAISLAQGEYMIFIDPDDRYPCDDCLKQLYVAAKKNSVLVCGGNVLSNDHGILKNWYLAGDGDMKQTQNGIVDINNYFFLYGHYRYLFKTSLIKENQVEYAHYKRYEDQVFTVKALGIAKTFYELDYPVYEYRINYKQWEMNSEMLFDILCGVRDTLQMMIKFDMQLMFEKNYWHYISTRMWSIVQYAFCGNNDIDRVIYELNSLVMKSGWDCDEAYMITPKLIKQYRNAIAFQNEKLEKIFAQGIPVIIYGAGNNTNKLMSNYQEQMQNVIGIAVSSVEGNHTNCKGVPVRNIEYYNLYKDDAIVLITPAEKMKDEIIDILEKLKFRRYEWVDVRLIK